MDNAIRLADLLKPTVRKLEPVIPTGILRDFYWKIQSRRINALDDRIFLRTVIVEQFHQAGARNVLFVGTRPYTRNYPRLFTARGMTLWTAEIDPAGEKFGNPGHHVTVDVLQLKPGTFPVTFDGVIFSGVIGYGVDDPSSMERAIGALVGVTKPGGLLVLGWNTDRSVDPLSLSWASEMLEPARLVNGSSRVTFPATTHIYDFLAARVKDLR